MANVSKVNLAEHVDIDGDVQTFATATIRQQYRDSVEKAKTLVRTLEFAIQSLYDDGATVLLTSQQVRLTATAQNTTTTLYDLCDDVVATIQANVDVVMHTVESIVDIGQQQAHMSKAQQRQSIERRKSRIGALEPRRLPPINTTSEPSEKNPFSEAAIRKSIVDPSASVDSFDSNHSFENAPHKLPRLDNFEEHDEDDEEPDGKTQRCSSYEQH